jgi:hypothetical protein
MFSIFTQYSTKGTIKLDVILVRCIQAICSSQSRSKDKATKILTLGLQQKIYFITSCLLNIPRGDICHSTYLTLRLFSKFIFHNKRKRLGLEIYSCDEIRTFRMYLIYHNYIKSKTNQSPTNYYLF